MPIEGDAPRPRSEGAACLGEVGARFADAVLFIRRSAPVFPNAGIAALIETRHGTSEVSRVADIKGGDLRLIQDYLGHKKIQNTVRYTALNAEWFRGLW